MANPRIPYRLSSANPKLQPLHGKRILVHLVVNVEHWVFENPMPRQILSPPHGRETVPDVPNFAWADYGMRSGLPRILGLLDGLPASASFNAGVIDAYPPAAEAILRAGWEFIGHGMHQKATNHVDGGEAGLIEACLDKLRSFTGHRPRGWLSPGLRDTFETPDLLKAAGLDYVCDWVVDDVPAYVTTAHGPLVAMPYNLEINDSVIYVVERHATGEMLSRLRHTLACFETEATDQVRILAIGLHPHLIGVPHRIHELRAMLDALRASPNVTFVTGSTICDWFTAQLPSEA